MTLKSLIRALVLIASDSNFSPITPLTQGPLRTRKGPDHSKMLAMVWAQMGMLGRITKGTLVLIWTERGAAAGSGCGSLRVLKPNKGPQCTAPKASNTSRFQDTEHGSLGTGRDRCQHCSWSVFSLPHCLPAFQQCPTPCFCKARFLGSEFSKHLSDKLGSVGLVSPVLKLRKFVSIHLKITCGLGGRRGAGGDTDPRRHSLRVSGLWVGCVSLQGLICQVGQERPGRTNTF